MSYLRLLTLIFTMGIATSIGNTANAQRRQWNLNRNFSTCPWSGTPQIEKMGPNLIIVANTKFNFLKRKHRFAFERLLNVCEAGHILPTFYEWRQAQNMVNAKTAEASAYAVSSGVQAAMTDSAARRQAIALDAAKKAADFAAEMTPLVADAKAKKQRLYAALMSTSAPASASAGGAQNLAARQPRQASGNREAQSSSSRPSPAGANTLHTNSQYGHPSAMAHTEVGLFVGSGSMSVSDESSESDSGLLFGLRASARTDSSWAPDFQFIRHSATQTEYGVTGSLYQLLMGIGARFYVSEGGIMPFVSAHLNYHLDAEVSLSDGDEELFSDDVPDSSGLGADLGGGAQFAVGDSLFADVIAYYSFQLTGETKLNTLSIGLGFGAKF